MSRSLTALALFSTLFAVTLTRGVGAQEPDASAARVPAGPPAMCRVSGRVLSGPTPLPGVTIIASTGGTATGRTSSDLDGRYDVRLPPGSYTLSASLTGFTAADRALDIATPCPPALDLQLAVAPRVARAEPTAPSQPTADNAGNPAAAGRRGGRGGAPGGGAPAGRGRFETLTVERQADAPANGATDLEPDQTTQLALPPGFSTESPTDSVAVNGDQANVNRGQLNDRLQALARGEFGPPPGAGGAPGGFAGAGPGGPGGAGGRPGGPGPGGPPGGGRGGFFGGRGQPQRAYSLTTNYSFTGSALDATPYRLRPDANPIHPDYHRQNVNLSTGGPIRIPGLYDGTGRTTFTLNYTSNRGANLFDQYATVPTAAMRTGDLSSLARVVVDPSTGVPFAGNQVTRIDSGAAYLLHFIPLPNLDGTARNFHYVTTTDSGSDNLNLRINHNFTPGAGGRGGRGRFGGPGGGGRGRGAQTGLSAALNAQVQYRHNDNERNNVFPTLGGNNTSSSLTIPVGLNISHNRIQHSVTVNVSRTRSTSANQYAFSQDVTGAAGIAGAATDGFDWGVPGLSFGSLSNLNDLTPSVRSDTRVTLGYSWARPVGRQTWRLGGDIRRDVSSSRTDSNATGTFVFTGLYSGSDFADFLLGLPQQASVAYGPGTVELHGQSMSLFVQDDWRASGRLTFNLGLRYELNRPLVEGNGQLVNLDVAPGFSAAAPVAAGGTGPYSGTFPDALVRTDINNLAPRLGMAWRAGQGFVIRGGYGVSFNSGSYASIARQLASQPPFAVTNTAIGTTTSPLALSSALTVAPADATTNTFGVDPDYQLGRVQTWNIDVSKNFGRVWTTSANYSYAIGSNLDLVRAPNRGPTGLRIENVQPFLWQSSESSSRLHSATFRVRRRAVRGIGGGLSYTLARSRDNASSIGGGTVVAQNDQDLQAEWGLSSFDRRHQFSGNVYVDLPFGPNRRWLNSGGFWGGVLESWSASASVTAQSGTPLTARVLSSQSDAARGTNGTLRADYNGGPIQLSNPTIDQYFNTAAFSVPGAGTFGNSGRNIIIGPGSKDLSAQLSRDVRLTGTRSLTIQLRANNLLNLVNYAGVDTVVNSPSFGQVTSVRSMRSMELNLRFRY